MPRLPLLALLLLASCAKMPDRLTVEKKYQLHGTVIRVDQQEQTATIKHEEIKGWMEPMTMEYPIKDKQEFSKLQVGEKIKAKILVQGTDYWIATVNPL